MNRKRLSPPTFAGLVLAAAFAATLATGCSEGTAPKQAAAPAPAAAAKTKTLENLQAAFQGEADTRALYLAFAQKAEVEGYGRLASLFRAAARGEEIHAGNLSDAIRHLGAKPAGEVKTPAVKSTAENIAAAVEGEAYERDTLYAEFLRQAYADGDKDAARIFEAAKGAEAEHARLYEEARKNLRAWKTPKQNFYVCPSCGFTTDDLGLKSCPVDHTATARFMPIS